LVGYAKSLDDMRSDVDSVLIKSGIDAGQQVVLVCGYPIGDQRQPNMALLHTIGSDPTVKLVRKLAQNNLGK
jgi:hypothetical protein